MLLQVRVLLQHLQQCCLLVWLLQRMQQRLPLLSLSLLGLQLQIPLVLCQLLLLQLRCNQYLLALLLWWAHCGSRGRYKGPIWCLLMPCGRLRLPLLTLRLPWLRVKSRFKAALVLPRLRILWLQPLLHLIVGVHLMLWLAVRQVGLLKALLRYVGRLVMLLVLLQCNVAQAQALQV